jgi:hypothetical protein
LTSPAVVPVAMRSAAGGRRTDPDTSSVVPLSAFAGRAATVHAAMIAAAMPALSMGVVMGLAAFGG